MTSRTKQKSQIINESLITAPALLLVAFILLVFPYDKALFNAGIWQFEGPIYWSVLLGSIALLLTTPYFYKNWTLREHRDVWGLMVWLIPLSYLISVMSAASYHSAINSIYIYVLYSVFFIIGLYFTAEKKKSDIFLTLLVGSGYVLVLYGFMNWFGNVEYSDAVQGGRMSNVFQYSNTYAAYLVGLLFSSITLLLFSKRWYIVLLHSVMLVPILCSLLLTLSRGGMIVLPVILVIFLFFLPQAKQIQSILYVALGGVASLLIFNYVTDLRTRILEGEANSVTGWLVVFAAAILVSAIIYYIQNFIGTKLNKKLESKTGLLHKKVIIPGALTIAAFIGFILFIGSSALTDLLPGTVKERITSLNSESTSVLSRTDFYSESLEVFRDYPLFGAGGGAWQNLYQKYQTYAYLSTQTHSYYAQVLLDVGLFGLVVLVAFLVYLFIYFIKWFNSEKQENRDYNRLIYFLFASSLLIHSFIDFDMSFVIVGIIVFACLGAMNASHSFKLISTTLGEKQLKWEKLYAIAMFAVSILLVIASIRAVIANSQFRSAIGDMEAGASYNRIIEKVNKAINAQSNHPDYVLFKVSLLKWANQQTNNGKLLDEAMQLINGIKSSEPFNRQLLFEELSIHEMKGDNAAAVHLLSMRLKDFPWDIDLYDMAIRLQADLGLQERMQGVSSGDYWANALELYEDLLKKNKHFMQLPEYKRMLGRSLEITPSIALSVGQIYYYE